MNKYFFSIYTVVFCFCIYPFIVNASSNVDNSSLNEKSSIIAQNTKSNVSTKKQSEDLDSIGPGKQDADIEYGNDIEEMNERTQKEIEEKRKLQQEQQKHQKKKYINRSGFLEEEKTEQNAIDSDDFSTATYQDSTENLEPQKEDKTTDKDKDSLITDDIPNYNVEDGSDDFPAADEKDSDLNMNMEMEMKEDPSEKDDFTDYDKIYNEEFDKERSDSGVDYKDDSFYETPEPSSNDPLDTEEYDSSFGTGF